jgi:hypothetical protein
MATARQRRQKERFGSCRHIAKSMGKSGSDATSGCLSKEIDFKKNNPANMTLRPKRKRKKKLL